MKGCWAATDEMAIAEALMEGRWHPPFALSPAKCWARLPLAGHGGSRLLRQRIAATFGCLLRQRIAATFGCLLRQRIAATFGCLLRQRIAATLGCLLRQRIAATLGCLLRQRIAATFGRLLRQRVAATFSRLLRTAIYAGRALRIGGRGGQSQRQTRRDRK